MLFKLYFLLRIILMKDQKIKSKRTGEFKGKYNQYTISIRMEPKDSLLIEVEDSISLDRWARLIDGQYIKIQEDPFYQSIFNETETIFNYISDNFSEVFFKPSILSFIYSYMNKTKTINIPLFLEKNNSGNSLQLKIDKVRKQFVQKLTQRDRNFKLLEQKYAKMEELLLKPAQKGTTTEKKQEYRIVALELQVKQLRVSLGKEEEKRKELQQRLYNEEERNMLLLKNQKTINTALTQKIQELIERQKYYEKLIDFKSISHHKGNTHSQYYSLKSSVNSTKIQKKGTNGNYNFVNKSEILPHKNNKYLVRIIHVKDSCLNIGFCTEKGLGNIRNFQSTEAVYYYCHSKGSLYEGGAIKDLSGCGSVDGDLLECVANLQEGKVTWRKDEKVLAECSLPAIMKGKSIYFSIILYTCGNSIEVASV